MTTEALFNHLMAQGVILSINGDRLRWDAPKGTITPELLGLMKERKQELLALMRADFLRAAVALLLILPDKEQRRALAEAYDERAGIREYDGNMPRKEAERLTYHDLVKWIERTHQRPDPGPGNELDH